MPRGSESARVTRGWESARVTRGSESERAEVVHVELLPVGVLRSFLSVVWEVVAASSIAFSAECSAGCRPDLCLHPF